MRMVQFWILSKNDIIEEHDYVKTKRIYWAALFFGSIMKIVLKMCQNAHKVTCTCVILTIYITVGGF